MVYIIGAGPGDPELISVKATRLLEKAEIILVDRLVSPEIISMFANPEAKVIEVGKQCSKGNRTSQESINNLLIEYGRKNINVVRLKGGDVSIFSNILDELKVLKENNIPYEIVPGITSFLGAAAYTAIPLTARGLSKGVRLLTAYDLDLISKDQWKEWTQTDDTLIFYMSGQKLKNIVKKFIEFKVSHQKEIAVIQQATTSEQKTLIFPFKDILIDNLPNFDFTPTLIIIGKTVHLYKSYQWFNEKEITVSYFDRK